MLAIFEIQCRKGCYTLDEDAKALVREYIERENCDGITFGNARGVRNIFEHILVSQANRLAAMHFILVGLNGDTCQGCVGTNIIWLS